MQIFWIELSKLKYKDFLNNLKNHILHWEDWKIVFTPNPEILLNTLKDKEFKEILQKADYLTIDWIWIYIWLQILENKRSIFIEILLLPYYFFNLFFRKKYLYKKYWERVCGSDLTKDLVEFVNEKGIKITIIDPFYPQDLKKCKSQKSFENDLRIKFPKLNFDYFIYNQNNLKNINHPEKLEVNFLEEIIKKIKNSDSKIIFSTLWMKSQEKSVLDIIEKCPNLKLWLWVGSSFDYFTWFQKRAPRIFRALWIEWLYRIITWPQKLKRIKRLYNAIFMFIWKVLITKKD